MSSTPSAASDDRLLARLQSPPDLSEGLESLDYWRARRERLAWYRVGARREAALMTERWERRVRAALFSQRGVSLRVRASAGLVLVGMHVSRRRSRALVSLLGVVVLATLALPAVATIALLTQIL
jgi:hypothetical protein